VIRNRTIWLVAIGLWLAGSALHCYLYVINAISSIDAEPGYETSWRFQLLMFAIFRMPIWIGVLAALAISIHISSDGASDRDVSLQ
jgi:hypothetical protein